MLIIQSLRACIPRLLPRIQRRVMLISTMQPRRSLMHWQTDDTWDHSYTLDEYVAKLKTETPDLLNAYDKYKKEKVDSEGNTVKDSDGNVVYEYDTEAMEKMVSRKSMRRR